MAELLKIPSSALVDEFLTQKGKDVIERMFLDFETAQHVTRFPDIDETLIIANMDVTKDLIYEFSSTTDFSKTEEALEVTDTKLITADFKVELKARIHERSMKAYRSYLKGAGLTMDDLHYVQHLINPNLKKMAEELENGLWQAVLDTTSGLIGNRKFAQRFDGYRKIARTAALASTPRATTVTTGAITDSNAVAKVEAMYRAAHKTMKQKGFNIYCSYSTFESYQVNYAATHQGREIPLQEIRQMQYTWKGIPLSLGAGNTYLVPVAGFGDDDALIATRPEFLAYGYNVEGEMGEWKIQEHGWEHWMLNRFPVGVQIFLQRPGFLLVNDRLLL